MNRASQRAADLTRQLLTFSRKQLVQPRVINLNQVVTDSLQMFRRLIPANITLDTKLDPLTTTIKADPGQIEQVIVNLVLNARDAMPDGGTLKLTTHRGEGLTGHVSNPSGGAYVSLHVTDTGIGMDAATTARIWEPFFTTKEVGKGTGLGLATVYGIVQQAGGHIAVESEPGQGASFTITFPFAVETPSVAPDPELRPDFARGSETVLLVEDEDAVRGLAAQILRSAGYTVLEASHGIEAAELTARYSSPIHLLVTDLVMPQMSGRTLADIVQSQRPGIRVLFMTGYCDASLLQPDEVTRPHVLSKPFTPKLLAATVRELLDAKPGEDAGDRRPTDHTGMESSE